MSAVTDHQLREGIGGPMRDQILDEIFKRMQEHFPPRRPATPTPSSTWKLGRRPTARSTSSRP